MPLDFDSLDETGRAEARESEPEVTPLSVPSIRAQLAARAARQASVRWTASAMRTTSPVFSSHSGVGMSAAGLAPESHSELLSGQTSPVHVPLRSRTLSPVFSAEKSDEAAFGERNLSSPVHIASHKRYTAANLYLSPRLGATALAHAQQLRRLQVGPEALSETAAFDDIALLAHALSAEDDEDDDDDDDSEDGVLLGNRAARYAARVFEAALVDQGKLVLDLGPHICELLLKRLVQRGMCSPEFQSILKQRVALSSFKSAKSGVSAGYQVPFDDVTDSRLHYKSAPQRDLFTNREAIKDMFLNLRGRFVQLMQPRDAEFAKQVRLIMEKLDSGNMAWFSQFFLAHLLTDDSVPDKELQRLAQGNEDKMRKLDQRMSSTPQRLSSSSSSSSTTNAFAKAMAIGSEDTSHIDELFTRPTERFFVSFIFASDSYALSSHLQINAMAELDKLAVLPPQGVSPDVLAQKMASLMLLARFLGFLLFSPRFASSRVLARNKELSLAFGRLYTSYLESGNHVLGSLSVESLLNKATSSASLTLMIPWLCALLRTALHDSCMIETRSFSSILAALRRARGALPRNSFGGVMALAEVDWFLAAFASVSSSAEEDAATGVSLALRETSSAWLLDTSSLVFDQCNVSSCELLERIRIALRQQAPSLPVLPTKQIQTVLVSPRPPAIASLAASFLHHADADIVRVDTFAVDSLPETAAGLVDVRACIVTAAIEAGGEADRLLDKALSAAVPETEAIVRRTLVNLFDLMCPRRQVEVRRAAVEVTCNRVMERAKVVLASMISALLKTDMLANSNGFVRGGASAGAPVANNVRTMVARKKGHAGSGFEPVHGDAYLRVKATRALSGRLGVHELLLLLEDLAEVTLVSGTHAIEDVWACDREAVDQVLSVGKDAALWRWIEKLEARCLPGAGNAGGGIVFRVVKGITNDFVGLCLLDEYWLGVNVAAWVGGHVELAWIERAADPGEALTLSERTLQWVAEKGVRVLM